MVKHLFKRSESGMLCRFRTNSNLLNARLWAATLLMLFLAGEGLAQAPMAYWKFRTPQTAGVNGTTYWENESSPTTQPDCAGGNCDYPFGRWVDGVANFAYPFTAMARPVINATDGVSDGYLNGDRMGFTTGNPNQIPNNNAWRLFGYYPNVAYLGSTSDALTCNYGVSGANEFTVEFFVRFGANSFEPVILSYPDIGFSSRLMNNGLRFEITTRDGGLVTPRVHTIPFDLLDRRSRCYYTDGTWHHIAVRYSAFPINGGPANQFKVWVDGFSDGTFAFETAFTSQNIPNMPLALAPCPNTGTNFSRIFVGSNAPASTRFDGDLDEIAIWRDALPDNLIEQHYLKMWCNMQNGNPNASVEVYNANFDPLYNCPNGTPGNLNPVFTGTLDLDQFPVDYVASPFIQNVGNLATATNQIQNYPTPRFRPGHNLHRNVPFIGNTQTTLGIYGNGAVSVNQATDVLEEMALEFNYYILAVNNIARYTLPRLNATNTNLQQELITLANQYGPGTANPIERCAVHFWGGLQPDQVININPNTSLPVALNGAPPNSNAYFQRANLPDLHGLPHYCNGGTTAPWSPMAPFGAQDPVYSNLTPNFNQMDGQTLVGHYDWLYGNGTTNHLDDPVIHYIAENGEEGMARCDQDEFVEEYFNATYGCENNTDLCWSEINSCEEEFWQYRRFLRREEYAGQLLNSTVNNIGNSLADTPYSWYWNSGRNGSYPFFRSLNFNPFFNRNIPTDFFYPQTPARWYNGVANFTGMETIVESRRIEIACGDDYFAPYVSPQVNDGGNLYFQEDQQAMRPGQYLGVLKLMMMMGAAYYHSFDVQVLANPVGTDEVGGTEFSVWQLAMPSYAQALITRYEADFMNSQLLEGDWDRFLGPVGEAKYMFWAGEDKLPVVVRQSLSSGQPIDRFMISGAVMTTSTPAVGENTPRQADVTIDLDAHPNGGPATDPITFEVRRQGSTYIYDRFNNINIPGKPPVFYQVDGWHDVSHPERWPDSFTFEAEVDDDLTNGSNGERFDIWTETPSGGISNPPTNNDYSDFTSYLRIIHQNSSGVDCWYEAGSGASADAPSASYEFDIRDVSAQVQLNLAVKARTRTATVPTGLFYELYEGNNLLDQGYLNSISTTSWEWYGWDEQKGNTVSFTGLSRGRHRLRLIPINSEVEIDSIFLGTNSQADLAEYTSMLGPNITSAGLPLIQTPTPTIALTMSGCVFGSYNVNYQAGGTNLGPCPLYEWTQTDGGRVFGPFGFESLLAGTGGTVSLHAFAEPGISGSTSVTFSAPCKWAGQPESASSSGLQSEESLEAFPNPTSGELELRMDLNYEEEFTIEFINSEGKIAQTRTIPSGIYTGKVSLGDLPDGLYMMRLTIPGRDIVRKILLMK